MDGEILSKCTNMKEIDDKSLLELNGAWQPALIPTIKHEFGCYDVNEVDQDDENLQGFSIKMEFEIKDEGEIDTPEYIHKSENVFIKSEPDFDSFSESLPRLGMEDRGGSSQHQISSVIMLKCEVCAYVTKQKSYLNRHMLIHKDPSEVKMHKCEICTYESKQRRYLNQHMLTHKNPSEITMYKCELCSHETKHKKYLRRHMLTHRSPGEVRMYNCEICVYSTKHKNSLNRHMLKHKDPSEITMYKCKICVYETKYRSCLNRHILVHNIPSEIMEYGKKITDQAKETS